MKARRSVAKRAGTIVTALAASLLGVPAIAQAQAGSAYAQASAATAPVADAYFAAYTSRDWDALEPLLAAEATFADPTATRVFGGVKSDGKAAIMERFRVGYAGLTHMRFATTRRLVSGDVVIYEGTLDWGLDLGDGTTVGSVTPMVIVVTVADGKVVEHRDYVDYAPFLEAVRKTRQVAN